MELVGKNELKQFDFAELTNTIKNAIPCDNSGITVSGLHTVFSELVNFRIEGTELELALGDKLDETEVGQSVSIPSSKNHKSGIGAVRSQGQIGSCVAFTTEAVFQYYEKRDNRKTTIFSPKYFYYHRNERLIARRSGGMNMGGVGDLASKYGTVPESVYPYENVSEGHGQSQIPSSVKRQGVAYGKKMYADFKYTCVRGDRYSFSDFIID